MALTPSFSASQILGAPSVIVLTDTSTGTDGTLTARRVFIQKTDGTYLVTEGTTTDYVEWAIGDTTISIDVLDKDYALQITVQWLAGTTVTYEETGLYLFYQYSEQFYYNLTQGQTSTPLIINDTSYYDNKMKLRCSIDEAVNATTYNDIHAAQSALDRALELRLNQNLYF